MVAKDRPKNTGPPKGAVGEIDTSAPFQSVKDAVNLFGEGAFSGSGEKPAIKKAKAFSAERVLAKETQLHLVQKELNKLKDQIKNAEITKAQALSDLEKAKKTVEDLTGMLKVVSVSKDSAVKATEAAESHVKKQIDEARKCDSTGGTQKPNLGVTLGKEYVSAIAAELDAAKKELWRIHHDYCASEEAKIAAHKQAVEAEIAGKEYLHKAGELSTEISAVGESIEQVKLANLHTLEEEAKLYAEKDLLKQSYTAKLEESAKKLIGLKEAIRLQDTELQVDHVRKNTWQYDVSVSMELDDAKESLQKVTGEEITKNKLLEMLKVELEDVKKEHAELKVKDAETEALAGNLHVKLRKAKSEFKAALAEESKIQGVSLEMNTALHSISAESEHVAEEMKKQAEEYKKEGESNRTLLETAEEKLSNALIEAEEAKAAEVMALENVKAHSASCYPDDRLDFRVIRQKTGTSLIAVACNGDVVFAADGQTTWTFGTPDELSNMKIYDLHKDVYALGSGDREALIRVTREMRQFAETKKVGHVKKFAQKLARIANRILNEDDDDIDIILIARLRTRDDAKIYFVGRKKSVKGRKYRWTPRHLSGLNFKAAGSGESFLHLFKNRHDQKLVLTELRSNQAKDGDYRLKLMNFAKDAIGEARRWDHKTDGNLHVVGLFKGNEAIHMEAEPVDKRNPFSGYGDLKFTNRRPLIP